MSKVANPVADLADKMDDVQIGKVTGEGDSIASPEKIVKHPLQNAWTLWFFKNDKSRTWEDNQRPIITVTTVEDFWALYNHIQTPSKLPAASDYSLFKEGIFPDWEDPRNQAGGRWIVSLDRKKREEFLDNHWLEVMFFLIGEHADMHSHMVNGAVVNIRNKGDKIAIWMAEAGGLRAEEDHGVVKVGKMVKEKLQLKDKIGFNVHKDEKNYRPGAANKAKYYV